MYGGWRMSKGVGLRTAVRASFCIEGERQRAPGRPAHLYDSCQDCPGPTHTHTHAHTDARTRARRETHSHTLARCQARTCAPCGSTLCVCVRACMCFCVHEMGQGGLYLTELSAANKDGRAYYRSCSSGQAGRASATVAIPSSPSALLNSLGRQPRHPESQTDGHSTCVEQCTLLRWRVGLCLSLPHTRTLKDTHSLSHTHTHAHTVSVSLCMCASVIHVTLATSEAENSECRQPKWAPQTQCSCYRPD
jgi:hypothetical protein